ncbi:MAG: protoporphyrinogen oxidase [Deltaproteobacteria bacterium]|nr:protoporphyrinogen oxidase [Deltaproteobacteria bacterium]
MPDVVVIGGGVSGMTVGFELVEAGLDPAELGVLEAADRPGGHIRAERAEGYVVEAGPNGFLDNSPPTLELVERLGLTDRLLPSNDAAAIRYIFTRGKLRSVPKGPGGMLTSGLLTLPGVLRVFKEPFVKTGGDPEESVFDFAARRIGEEAAATLVDAMVSGVFAGDARQLELVAAFPKMAAMEAEHGSLVKAMIAIRKQRKRDAAGKGDATAAPQGGPSGPAGRLTSFIDGFEELPRALAARLGPSLRTSCPVNRLERTEHGWRVYFEGGEPIEARAVVLACPAPLAAQIAGGVDETLERELSAIRSTTVAVVATGYPIDRVGGAPEGFGFLVPRGQEVRILGCLWTSSIWNGRAPDDRVLLRTMVGGAHDPDSVELSDDELLAIVRGDLSRTMGIEAEPVFTRVFRHRLGISQYPPGHTARLGRIREILARYPGLFISGSSYGGIAVNHCVAEAPAVAAKVIVAGT